MTASELSKITIQAEMLSNRLQKRQRHLKKWARRTGVGMYRLYDRDIPEIPLVLDWIGGTAVSDSSEAAVTGALYKRPYEKNKADEAAWLYAMQEAIASALDIKPELIFLRERKKQPGKNQYERLTKKELQRIVLEYGLSYLINLTDYLDTGLFPDRRLLRRLLYRESSDCCILNLFCYTGSLSVAAAAGGAAVVDSVDLSGNYLSWAGENFKLNGKKADMLSPEQFFLRTGSRKTNPFTFIRADVLRFIEEARRRFLRWDKIILDPPAFSNSKKMSNDFDIKRDHGLLVEKCLKLLNPGGVLYLSANAKSFKLNKEIMDSPNLAVKDITEQLRDEDFKGKRLPGTWRITDSLCV